MTLRLTALLEGAVDRIEKAEVLDPFADKLAPLIATIAPPGPVKDALSGSWLGHPVHPVLVSVPIGSWLAASWLDLTGGADGRRAATRLVGLGNLAALPTALTGASDWVDTAGAERRIGLVHALLNYGTLGIYALSWRARRRGRHGRGALLSLVGAGVVGASGFLGGHLAYAQGVGVDTTAFQHGPSEWTDVAADAEVTDGAPVLADAAGVPVVLVRQAGVLHALADRCTHRGGPLHEGDVVDGCLTCPWHGSAFALDGSVVRGPATRPQPAYEVRVVTDRVEVRRAGELRGLRQNPVGV